MRQVKVSSFHFCYKMERWEHLQLIPSFFHSLNVKPMRFRGHVSKPNQSRQRLGLNPVYVCEMKLSILLNRNRALEFKWNTWVKWCKEINTIINKNDAHQFSSCFTVYSKKGPSRYLLTFEYCQLFGKTFIFKSCLHRLDVKTFSIHLPFLLIVGSFLCQKWKIKFAKPTLSVSTY